MRVCIVGPMRGLPGHNFAAFDAATTRWLEAGHVVYNPAQADRAADFDGTTEPPRGFLEAAMCRDITEYARADALAVLPGWEQSRMAPVEVAFVRALDPPRLIFDAITMQPLEMNGATVSPAGAVRGDTAEKFEVFATGAKRHLDRGRGHYEKLPWRALHRVACLIEGGQAVFGERNAELGMPIGRCVRSAIRHEGEYLMGDRSKDWLIRAAWNLLMAAEYECRIAEGDLPESLADVSGGLSAEEFTLGPKRARSGDKGF